MKRYTNLIFCFVACLMIFSFSTVLGAENEFDASPPDSTQKLIFIHHSCGENWLSDDNGGLGYALGENNYFVSDTNYGWGPNGIGDATDIPDWLRWFRSDETPTITNALYNEFSNNWYGWQYFDRPMADPGGENDIVLFKSCYPNSELWGSPDDPAGDYADWTVAGAKYVYNELLQYFLQHPEKLFVVITAPPNLNRETGENARAFNNWLVNDWLMPYSGTNVAVWDFYAVLSDKDNHHRFIDGEIEYTNEHGNGTAAYDSWGDPHPNTKGNTKATEEFVPMLNIYVNRWLTGNPAHVFPSGFVPLVTSDEVQPTEAQENQNDEPENDTQEQQTPGASLVLIDDFDGEFQWEVFHGENATIACEITSRVYISPPNNLEISVEVPTADWTSCEYYFPAPKDLSTSKSLSLELYADTLDFPFSILIYAGDPEAPELFGYELVTTQEQYQQWQTVQIPWKNFIPISSDTAILDLSQVEGIAFAFGTDTPIAGTIAIEDFYASDLSVASEALFEVEQDQSNAESIPMEENSENSIGILALRRQLCGSVFLIPLLPVFFIIFNRRRPQ